MMLRGFQFERCSENRFMRFQLLAAIEFVKRRSIDVSGVPQNRSLLTPDDLFRDSQTDKLID